MNWNEKFINDYVFALHRWEANEAVIEKDDSSTPKESAMRTREFTAAELSLSTKDFAEMFAGAYVQQKIHGTRYFIGAYNKSVVVLSSIEKNNLDPNYWTYVCCDPNGGATRAVNGMAPFVLEITPSGCLHLARDPLKSAGFPSLAVAAGAPAGNHDARAWQDAWNAKFKTYNRMTSFLANLSMKNFPIELERERREIVHLAMKEINPKAVENDAKAFNEMAAKVKDR